MKFKIKTLLIILILVIGFFGISNTNAAGDTIKVYIPIDFSPVIGICSQEGSGADIKYFCNVPKGVTGFETVVAGLVKYITFIAGLAGVLFIVVNGVLYSMGGADDSLKTESKKRIVQTLIGLILLLMSGVILHIVAPWVYL